MPALDIPADTYARLAAQAVALGTTIEALALPALEEVAKGSTTKGNSPAPANELSDDEWRRVFDKMLTDTRSRADRYPTGFRADVSRESIYEGCGE